MDDVKAALHACGLADTLVDRFITASGAESVADLAAADRADVVEVLTGLGIPKMAAGAKATRLLSHVAATTPPPPPGGGAADGPVPVTRKERARIVSELDTLEKIASACGVSVDEILTYRDDQLETLVAQRVLDDIALQCTFVRLVKARKIESPSGRGPPRDARGGADGTPAWAAANKETAVTLVVTPDDGTPISAVLTAQAKEGYAAAASDASAAVAPWSAAEVAQMAFDEMERRVAGDYSGISDLKYNAGKSTAKKRVYNFEYGWCESDHNYQPVSREKECQFCIYLDSGKWCVGQSSCKAWYSKAELKLLNSPEGYAAAASDASAAVATPEWIAANKERRLPPHKHDKKSKGVGIGDIVYTFWRCCLCTDETSTYCCAPTSSTHLWIKVGCTYNGHGDQTDDDSYIRP